MIRATEVLKEIIWKHANGVRVFDLALQCVMM